MSRKRILLTLSLLVLGVVAFMITTGDRRAWLRSHDANASAEQNSTDSVKTDQPRSQRRVKSELTVKAKPTHSYAELKDFIIPELRLENITFKQALYELNKKYNEICKLSGETPISFRFKIEGASNRPIQFTLRNLSFTAMLETLSAIEGMSMLQDGRDVSFSPLKDSGTKETRLMTMSPTMMEKLSTASSKLGIKLDSMSNVRRSSAMFTFQHDLYQLSFIPTLSKLLDIPESSFTFKKSTSQLSITADAVQADRIDTLVANFLSKPVLQVKIKSQVITVSPDSNFDPATISDPDFFRHLASTPGVDILTSPTLVMRAGETATISMTEEFTYQSESNDSVKDATGLTIENQAGFAGFGLNASAHYDSSYRTNDSANPVKHIETAHSEYTRRSTPSIVRLNTHDGSQSYLILTHEEIDASGRTVTRSR